MQLPVETIASRSVIIIDDNNGGYVVRKQYPQNVRKRYHRISQKVRKCNALDFHVTGQCKAMSSYTGREVNAEILTSF